MKFKNIKIVVAFLSFVLVMVVSGYELEAFTKNSKYSDLFLFLWIIYICASAPLFMLPITEDDYPPPWYILIWFYLISFPYWIVFFILISPCKIVQLLIYLSSGNWEYLREIRRIKRQTAIINRQNEALNYQYQRTQQEIERIKNLNIPTQPYM